MTEVEKIAYAKSFIDKLANGVNPIDNTAVSEDDIVSNVRISKCLHYVSEILGKVCENGGIVSKSRVRKVPFTITREQLDKFPFSATPIAVSEIANRITALCENEDMKNLSHHSITEWLLSIDMLYMIRTGEKRTVKRPTENGIRLGISVEERQGSNGAYHIVLYNLDAQHFIIDNFEAILDIDEKRRKEKEHGGNGHKKI